MIIVMNRDQCDAQPSFGARCPANVFKKPSQRDRPWVQRIIDDGDDDTLGFILMTEGRTLRFRLTDETLEGLQLEGWEFLADFDPALVRRGAAERWRQIAATPSGPH